MKLIENYQTVETVGTLKSAKFSIAATPVAFKILSSNLYKNKEEAIVRELACNCVDSHIENGNSDQPFDMYLPNNIDPVFRVRDYGLGLSEKDVLELYATYFASTKRESNDLTGAFGLGRLSIFSLTDNFSIISYFNGQKSSFHAYIGSEGFPEITLIHQEDSIEPNGMEVFFNVSQSNLYGFQQAARKVLKYFDVVPNIKNVQEQVEKFSPEWQSLKDGVLFHFSGQHTSPGVIMGNVFYPIENASLGNTLKVLNHCIIKVPIGSVSVTASRESLEYDDNTKDFLRRVDGEILELYNKEYENDIASCQSLYDVICFNCSSKYVNFPLSLHADFNGSQISSKENTFNIASQFSPYGTWIYNPTKELKFFCYNKTPSNRREENLSEYLNIDKYRLLHIQDEYIEFSTFRYTKQHLCHRIADEYGIPRENLIFVDDIKIKRDKKREKVVRKVYIEKVTDYYYSNKTVCNTDLDNNSEGFYLTKENRKVNSKLLSISSKWSLHTLSAFLETNEIKTPVYLINKSDVKKILKQFPKWKNFEEFVEQEIQDPILIEKIDTLYLKQNISDKEHKIYELISQVSKKKEAIEIAQQLLDIKNTKTLDLDKIDSYNSILWHNERLKPDEKKLSEKLLNCRKVIVNHYPVLGLELLGNPVTQVFTNYIKEMDKNETSNLSK